MCSFSFLSPYRFLIVSSTKILDILVMDITTAIRITKIFARNVREYVCVKYLHSPISVYSVIMCYDQTNAIKLKNRETNSYWVSKCIYLL